MDVLVTGGTGFIGRHLCVELLDRDHTVAALSRNPEDAPVPDEVEILEADVTEYDTLERTIGDHDAVVHLVSLSPVFSPPGGEERHELVTVGGTRNVVRAMEETGIERLLFLSGLGADPEGPTAFIRTKGRAEEIIRASDLGWTIVRPSVVFGEGGEFLPFTRMVSTPYVTGLPSGGQTRFQPIWVGDLVTLLANTLDSADHLGATYEVGGPHELTLAEVTRLAHAANGRPVQIIPVPMIAARVALTAAGVVPFVPFGPDQYRSLTFDNTTDDNDVERLGKSPADLLTVEEYLGLKNNGESIYKG